MSLTLFLWCHLFSSLQMTSRTSHTQTGTSILTSRLTSPAFPGASVWETVCCRLCHPPVARRLWPPLCAPNARAGTHQPAWTPSLWSGTMITTWAVDWRPPAESCPLSREIKQKTDTCRARHLLSQVSVCLFLSVLGSAVSGGQLFRHVFVLYAMYICVSPDVVIPESPEAYLKLTEQTLRSSAGRKQQQISEINSLVCCLRFSSLVSTHKLNQITEPGWLCF